jgi:hypothetical protein
VSRIRLAIVITHRPKFDTIARAAKHPNYQVIWPLFKKDMNRPEFWNAALEETPGSGRLKLLISLGGDVNTPYPLDGNRVLLPLVNLILKQPVMEYAKPGDKPLKSVTKKIDSLVDAGTNLEWSDTGLYSMEKRAFPTILNLVEDRILYFRYLVDNIIYSKYILNEYYRWSNNDEAKQYVRKSPKH